MKQLKVLGGASIDAGDDGRGAVTGRAVQRRRIARHLVAEIESRASSQYVPSYEIAKVHIALGDTALGLDWFERAYRERAHSMVFLKVDPQLAGMERHPRYAALLDRVGLK